MAETITIICSVCGLKVDTPRCNDDPKEATELRGVECPDCDTGGFDMPEFYNTLGSLVFAAEPI